MNYRPSSNLSGRIVPMFALNNKKKRLRQALYANPTTDTFEDSSAAMLESAGGGCLGVNGVVIPQESFWQLQGPKSSNKERNAVGSSSSMQQNHKSIGSGGKSGTSSPCSGRYCGTNQGGAQVRQPIKQQTYSFLNNSMDSPTTNSTPSNKTARTMQHQPVKVFQDPGIKVEKQDMTKQRGPDQQDHSFQSKEWSTKQMNLMANPTDKSLKFLTATVQSVLKWALYEDKVTSIYEIFGILDSQVSLNAAGNGKNFVIKDKTGILRCTFWEMDRQLPRLTRGQMHRCIGFLDKKSGTFNCVSIRPSKQTELQCMADFLKGSELAMQQQLATFKED